MTNHKSLLSCLAACVATAAIVAIFLNSSNAEEQTKKESNQRTEHEDSGESSGAGFGFGFGIGAGGARGEGFGGTSEDDFVIGGPPAIAANSKYVFIVHNNTLYQFAADDLKAIRSVPLEVAEDAAE